MNKQMAAIMITAIIVGLSLAAVADTIVLKNGSRVSGLVLDPNKNPVVLKIPKGKITYDHSEIAEIILDRAQYHGHAIAGVTSRTNEVDEAAELEEAMAAIEAAEGKPLSKEDVMRVLWYLREFDKIHEEDAENCKISGFDEDRQKLAAELGKLGPASAPIIERAIEKGNPEVVPFYMAGLMAANPERGAAVATEAITSHGRSTVRLMAINLLAQQDAKKHRVAIDRATKDTQGNVRFAALNALRETKDPASIPTFLNALDDKLDDNRMVARLGISAVAGSYFKTEREARAWVEEQRATEN